MRIARTLACLTVVAALTACTGPNGYYDSRGHWHESTTYVSSPDGRNYYTDHSARKGDSAGVIGYDKYRDETLRDYSAYEPADDVTIVYKRGGYYDRDGVYYAPKAGPRVAAEYFPPRGLCRVWLPGVAPIDQPAVESCVGIQSRVPAGAYVIYGG